MKLILFISAVMLLTSCGNNSNEKLSYPITKKGNVVDTIFGTPVPDPYRWLEDDKIEPNG
jgi:prolyl oligopeptidase